MKATRRQCIIHIGLHKTGSTAIQASLMANQERLAGVGICYQPNLPGEHKTEGHHKIAASLRGGTKAQRLEGLDYSGFLRLIRSTDADILVLSSEAFSHPRVKAAQVQGFASTLHDSGFDVTAIVYVRPHAELFNSGYTQNVKTFRFAGSFCEFVTHRLESGAACISARIQPWSDAVGMNVVVEPYDKSLGTGIAEAMLRAAGVPPERLAAARLMPASYINEAPGPKAIAAFRLLMAKDENLVDVRHRALRLRAAEEAKRRRWFDEKFVGLEERTVRRIGAYFDEDNERFAAQFWGRSWREVFADHYAQAWRSNELDLEQLPNDVRAEMVDFVEWVTAPAPRSDNPGPLSQAARGKH